MNNSFPEIAVELKRQQIKEEMEAIRLQKKAGDGRDLSSKYLAALGEWMVARGERLRRRHSTVQTGSMDLIKKVA